MKLKQILIPLSVALLLVVGVPTAAATSGEEGYDEAAPLGAVNQAASNSSSPEATSAAASEAPAETGSASILPFTGLELAVFVLLGLSLIGLGVLLRRATRSNPRT